MKRVSLGLLLILTLSLLGSLLQRACEALDLPFLAVTVLRDLLLVVLFLWTVKTVPLLEAKWVNSLLLLFGALFAWYAMASLFEDRFILGLFYARLYLLPVLFFVAAKIALQSLDRAGVTLLLRNLIVINLLMLVAAVALFLVTVFYPEQRAVLFGANIVPYAWFAAGEGGNLMRMGLPMASPNHLGLYFGVMLFLFLILVLGWHATPPYRKICVLLVGLNMAGLAATFSRSSLLLVVVAVISLFIFVPALRSREMRLRGLIAGLALMATLGCGLLVVERVTDGFVTRWLSLNMDMRDPSLAGHWQSLVDAYNNFAEYYLYGYPRGTVGPRAVQFNVGDRFNVENSMLSAIYDFGLMGAAVFFCGYYLMLSAGYRSRFQLALLAGFLICVQTLPYVFEPAIISLFMLVFLLIGQLDRLGYFAAYAGGDGRVAALRPLPALAA